MLHKQIFLQISFRHIKRVILLIEFGNLFIIPRILLQCIYNLIYIHIRSVNIMWRRCKINTFNTILSCILVIILIVITINRGKFFCDCDVFTIIFLIFLFLNPTIHSISHIVSLFTCLVVKVITVGIHNIIISKL